MAKQTNKTKQTKSKIEKLMREAVNAVITAIVRTLLGWAEEWGNDAFFFLVIGDKRVADVAWSNSWTLCSDGAFAITSHPEAASAFEYLKAGYDALIGTVLEEDEKFKEHLENHVPDKEDDSGWSSVDLDPYEEPSPEERKQTIQRLTSKL